MSRVSGTTLTPRESAVLAAVERRLTNPEIAAEMFVSTRTVESHIASLRRKLGRRVDRRSSLRRTVGARRPSGSRPIRFAGATRISQRWTVCSAIGAG